MKVKEVALRNQTTASIHAAIGRRHYDNGDLRSARMHQVISGDYYAITREAYRDASWNSESIWGDLGPCERRWFTRSTFDNDELLDLMEEIMDRFHDHPHFEVLVWSSSRDEDDSQVINLTAIITPMEDALKS